MNIKIENLLLVLALIGGVIGSVHIMKKHHLLFFGQDQELRGLSHDPIKWQCYAPDGLILGVMPPGKKVEIWHERMPRANQNMCSDGIRDGRVRTLNIYGQSEKLSQLSGEMRKYYRDVPFPDIFIDATVIILTRNPSRPTDSPFKVIPFKMDFQKLELENPTDHDLYYIMTTNTPRGYYSEKPLYTDQGYSITIMVKEWI